MNRKEAKLLERCLIRPCIKMDDLPMKRKCKVIKMERLQTKFGSSIKTQLEVCLDGKEMTEESVFLPSRFSVLTDNMLKIFNTKPTYLRVEEKIGNSYQVTLRLEEDDDIAETYFEEGQQM